MGSCGVGRCGSAGSHLCTVQRARRLWALAGFVSQSHTVHQQPSPVCTAAGRAFLSPMEIATDPTCFSFDCWLFPDWQLRLKGSEAGAEGASFWVNIPSTQTPLNQQGVALLIIHAAVLSPQRERGRDATKSRQKSSKILFNSVFLPLSPQTDFYASSQPGPALWRLLFQGWKRPSDTPAPPPRQLHSAPQPLPERIVWIPAALWASRSLRGLMLCGRVGGVSDERWIWEVITGKWGLISIVCW